MNNNRLGELIEAEDAALARVAEFIRQGMRTGRISAKAGELLIDAAESEHRASVERLREQEGERR